MRLGLGSYAFRWQLGIGSTSPARIGDLEDLPQETHALGCSVLQLADLHSLELASDHELTSLRGKADDAGIRLQTGFSGATVGRLERNLHIAQQLGADLVRVVLHGHGVDDEHEALTALEGQAPAYAEAQVTLAIENHFQTPSSELAAMVTGLGNDAIGITLDVANSIACREWPEETVSLLAPHVRCLHLKDYRITPNDDGVGAQVTGAPLGGGWTDIDFILDAIEPYAPPDLAVVLEQWSPGYPDRAEATAVETQWRRASAAFARQHPRLAAKVDREEPT